MNKNFLVSVAVLTLAVVVLSACVNNSQSNVTFASNGDTAFVGRWETENRVSARFPHNMDLLKDGNGIRDVGYPADERAFIWRTENDHLYFFRYDGWGRVWDYKISGTTLTLVIGETSVTYKKQR
jgi:hypothetical protein